ncbi:MAG: hypothetical protein OIN66_08055 [Candidatus Methanoperedens sp.]|nr:hypothetical protein [Candidatus Methanoperedens sp.]
MATKKRKPNLKDYFGSLKGSKAIIEIKEDIKKIRESARNGADKIASTDKRFDEISKVTGLEILKSSF